MQVTFLYRTKILQIHCLNYTIHQKGRIIHIALLYVFINYEREIGITIKMALLIMIVFLTEYNINTGRA